MRKFLLVLFLFLLFFIGCERQIAVDQKTFEQMVSHRSLGLAYLEEERYSAAARSEEHTSELQSRTNLVCRLLLEKKKTNHSHLPHPSPFLLPSNRSPPPTPFHTIPHLHAPHILPSLFAAGVPTSSLPFSPLRKPHHGTPAAQVTPLHTCATPAPGTPPQPRGGLGDRAALQPHRSPRGPTAPPQQPQRPHSTAAPQQPHRAPKQPHTAPKQPHSSPMGPQCVPIEPNAAP